MSPATRTCPPIWPCRSRTLLATGGWSQWLAHSVGMDLVPRTESTEERIFRLEAENAQLRSAAA